MTFMLKLPMSRHLRVTVSNVVWLFLIEAEVADVFRALDADSSCVIVDAETDDTIGVIEL